MHIFNVSITTVQSLKNVNLKVWEELIHKVGAVYSKYLGKMTTFNYMEIFGKSPNTSKKLHAHLQCVHNTCARFDECQLKRLHKVGAVCSKHPGKMTKFNYM